MMIIAACTFPRTLPAFEVPDADKCTAYSQSHFTKATAAMEVFGVCRLSQD